MHSDVALENVLLRGGLVIVQPWIAPLVVVWWRCCALGMAESALGQSCL